MTIRLREVRTASLTVLAIGALQGCNFVDRSATEKASVSLPATATPAPRVETPRMEEIVVDRRQLLEAAALAASAFAAGEDDSSQPALAGRQFMLRIPIGCGGESDTPTGWLHDAASGRLTLRATPDIALADVREKAAPVSETAVPAPTPDEVSAPRSEAVVPPIEAVDGFWLLRPWLLTDQCPQGSESGDGSDSSAADRSVGVAQYYTARDPRTGRRGGQPYRITKRLTPDTPVDGRDLRLVLRGRLTAWPEGQLFRCSANGDTRPRCVASATFDRVSFENKDGTVVHATWGNR